MGADMPGGPEDPATQRRRATEAHQGGDLDTARTVYAAYLAQVPGDALAWSNLGALHRTEKRYDQARRAHERALALAPESDPIAQNAANVFSDIGAYDRSIALRRRLLAARPDDPVQLGLIGRCLRGQGRYREAIDWLATALEAHPEEPELHMQMAFAQLAAGDYARGFEHYRWRWQAGELAPRTLDLPEWQGEPLDGRTILVLPEQGFGDAILFARFLPRLKALGARVVMPVKRPLMRLFTGLPGVDSLSPAGETPDVYVNMMDLALLHFRDSDTVPPPPPLHVPDDSDARARRILQPLRGPLKVGVVWTGSVTYKGNAFRSFSHTDYLPLADIAGVQLVSLYKGPELVPYRADGSDAFLVDAGATERDFADTAAMMRHLDLVITSDTATAHLAGTLGVPTWCVLHWDPFWVWGHEGETTPWYPGMRLFRQTVPMDWAGVMAEVGVALGRQVESANE